MRKLRFWWEPSFSEWRAAQTTPRQKKTRARTVATKTKNSHTNSTLHHKENIPTTVDNDKAEKLAIQILMNVFPRDEDGNLIDHVPGLEYYRDFLSPQEQEELLALIDANPWQEGVIARRQQFYGEVYYHTSFKSKVLQGCSDKTEGEMNLESDQNIDNGDRSNNSTTNSVESDSNRKNSGNGIPMDDSGMRKWLDRTMPFFEQEGLMEPPTQILINEYKNNMGIASHFEDFEAFGPVILTVSLVSPVYMTLKKPTIQPSIDIGNKNNKTNINACDTYDDVVKVLLEPGSLLIMKDDARYKYRHGIGKYKWVNLPPLLQSTTNSSEDQAVAAAAATTRIKRDNSYRRVSLTIRHLLSTRRKVNEHEDESDTIKDPSVY